MIPQMALMSRSGFTLMKIVLGGPVEPRSFCLYFRVLGLHENAASIRF